MQGFLSSQSVAAPLTHLPPLHASPVVHGLPSLQATLLLVNTQPLVLSHASSVHKFLSSQTIFCMPVQTPPPQASPLVHASRSSHGSVLLAKTQPACALQASVVQRFLSSHLSDPLPARQPPPAHVSPSVHAFLSSHGAVFGKYVQPLAMSQLSSVHGLPSLHADAMPPRHVPWLHASPLVHAFLSSHGWELNACRHPSTALHVSVVHTLPSSQLLKFAPTHAPALHMSVCEHTFLSSQGELLTLCTHASALSQLSSVHGLPSSQFVAPPLAHAPPVHASPDVQALLSVHPSALFACVQPVFVSQPSSVHGLPSSQFMPVMPAHTPALHAPARWHALPSPHLLPSARLTFGAHVLASMQSSLVHGLLSSQLTLLVPAHLPALQWSPAVQLLPSSHVLASLFACWQPATASHVSSVQGLPSSQLRACRPPVQLPAAQMSPIVQTLLSLQLAVFTTCEQPVAGSHASSVHGLPSSQPSACVPAVQDPSTHASPTVQAFWSLHAAVLLVCEQLAAAFTSLQTSSVHGLPSLQL